MLVRVNKDGGETDVQIVRRKNGTVYIRRYTPLPPTENQFQVRKQLALASISSFGKSREEVVRSVSENVVPVSVGVSLNRTEAELYRDYPEVLEIVRKRNPFRAKHAVPVLMGEEKSENM